MTIELEQNAADESNIDPNQFFQIVQSADNRASLQLIRAIDFDVSIEDINILKINVYCAEIMGSRQWLVYHIV